MASSFKLSPKERMDLKERVLHRQDEPDALNTLWAKEAQRMADAFGLFLPYAKPKATSRTHAAS